MKMRELEKRTGVRREMIHYYLRNGLLSAPERPKPNVAEYGEEHVRGINALRRLQTERRLSIEEIKQALNGNSAAIPADALVFPQLDVLVAARMGADESLVSVSSIKDRNPCAEKDARTLDRIGAIQLKARKGRQFVSQIDAQIVALWGDMRAAGFTEDEGFDPAVVSIYVDVAKNLAKAEIREFLTRVSAVHSTEKKAELAQAGLTVMMSLFALLRMKGALKELGQATL